MSRRPQSNRGWFRLWSGQKTDFATSVVDDSRLSAVARSLKPTNPPFSTMSVAWSASLELKKLTADASLTVIVAWPAVLLPREIYEARIETASCIIYLAKNEFGHAGRASVIEIDRRGCANSTHYIERWRICETGHDADAVDVYRCGVDIEDIVRCSELKVADGNVAGHRNHRRRSPAEDGASVRARDSRKSSWPKCSSQPQAHSMLHFGQRPPRRHRSKR